MAGALRPGARLVAEFGGAGNVRRIRAATDRALQEAGLAADALQHPWFNPTAEEYTAILGEAGLRVTMAELFERPTPLEGQDGLRNWLEMFRRPHFHDLDPETVGAILDRTVEIARPDLYADGTWHADYVRLRVAAVKPQAARGARPSSRSL